MVLLMLKEKRAGKSYSLFDDYIIIQIKKNIIL